MEKHGLTPDEFVAELANRAGLTHEQVRAFLQAQAEMAYAHGDEGFPIPGVGHLRVVSLPRRGKPDALSNLLAQLPMKEGASKEPVKNAYGVKKLVFRFTQTGSAGLFGHAKKIPNVFKVEWYPAKENEL